MADGRGRRKVAAAIKLAGGDDGVVSPDGEGLAPERQARAHAAAEHDEVVARRADNGGGYWSTRHDDVLRQDEIGRLRRGRA